MYKTLLIKDVYAGVIFDSGGNLAVEIKILAGEDAFGRSVVTYQGCNINQKENNMFLNQRMKRQKTDITQTVEYINSVIAQKIIGMNIFGQEEIDCLLRELITGGKINGLSISFGISSAIARAAACALNFPLFRYLGGIGKVKIPMPAVDIFVNHFVQSKKREPRMYMLVPADRKMIFYDGLTMCCEVICEMYEIFRENGTSETDAIFIMRERQFSDVYYAAEQAAQRAGYKIGKDVLLVCGNAPVKLTGKNGIIHGNIHIRDEIQNEKTDLTAIDTADADTITGLFEYAADVLRTETKTAFYLGNSKQEDELSADIAAALGTDYFVGGALPFGENTMLFNRLIQIENEILSRPSFRVARPGCC